MRHGDTTSNNHDLGLSVNLALRTLAKQGSGSAKASQFALFVIDAMELEEQQ